MRAYEFERSVSIDGSSGKTLAKLDRDAEDIRREQDGQNATSPASLATPVEQMIGLYKTGRAEDIEAADAILDTVSPRERHGSAVLAARLIAGMKMGIRKRRQREERRKYED